MSLRQNIDAKDNDFLTGKSNATEMKDEREKIVF